MLVVYTNIPVISGPESEEPHGSPWYSCVSTKDLTTRLHGVGMQ